MFQNENIFWTLILSGLLHYVAYGVTKIKYDSGEEQKVAHAVLTTKYSHAISFYLQSSVLMVYFLFILSSQSDFQYCNSNCKIKKKKVFLIWCDLIYVSKHLMNLT